MNNPQGQMIHYRIKSTAKSQKEAPKDMAIPVMCTVATVFSLISAAASVAICRKIKNRRFGILR